MTAARANDAIGQALVEFSTIGAFPEEHVSSLELTSQELPAAIQLLSEAKVKLEAEIDAINQDTAPDLSSWMANAQSLQDDIYRSTRLANDILRQAEEPVFSGKEIQEADANLVFLQAELAYRRRVQETLGHIREIQQTLDQIETACEQRRILDALQSLDKSWAALDALPVGQSVRIRRLLDLRAFQLQSTVHDVFDHVWKALVHVDIDSRVISMHKSKEDEGMVLSDAVMGLQVFKEVDQRMAELWHDIDRAVLGPRLDFESPQTPGIVVVGDTLRAEGQVDKSIDSLFADMRQCFSYLADRLPHDLIESISALMVPEIVSRIISVWLDSAVPVSLGEMERFEITIESARNFCTRLSELKFSGFVELQEWVENAPSVWLAKCTESALNTVRLRLSEGLGKPKQVERVEKQMLSHAEGRGLAAAPANAAAAEDDDWGAAWDDDTELQDQPSGGAQPESQDHSNIEAAEVSVDSWGWGDESEDQQAAKERPPGSQQEVQADDSGEAWGWGDEDDNEAHQNDVAAPDTGDQRREMTLKETYNITSMPEPVLQLIFAILEDGATLTREGNEDSLVTTAAASFFNLPTLALAMFRAVSPYYYSLDVGGNMFLYNDATYLTARLDDFATAWKKRTDLSPRAQNLLHLENDVKTLHSFAARAYGKEMNIQKTVLRDLLGGEQSLLQQQGDLDNCVNAVTARVRSMAAVWEGILARSAWYQAVGSLVDAIALKIISDVMDAPSISQDDAYNMAKLIANVTELDDLFLPGRVTGKRARRPNEEIPQTMQYAPSWMRLKYLGEVLQSNLRDVRFLWMESELSLYFAVDEVIDLINLSFEDNARTREVMREIRANPQPLLDDQQGGGSSSR